MLSPPISYAGPSPYSRIAKLRHSPSGLLLSAVTQTGGVWLWHMANPSMSIDATQAFSKRGSDLVFLNSQTLFAVGGLAKAMMHTPVAPPSSFLPVATRTPSLQHALFPASLTHRRLISPFTFNYWEASASVSALAALHAVDLAAALPDRHLLPGTPLLSSRAFFYPGPFPFSSGTSVRQQAQGQVFTAVVEKGGDQVERKWEPAPPDASAMAASPAEFGGPRRGGSMGDLHRGVGRSMEGGGGGGGGLGGAVRGGTPGVAPPRDGHTSLRIIDLCEPQRSPCVISASLHHSHSCTALLYDEASQAIISGGEKGDIRSVSSAFSPSHHCSSSCSGILSVFDLRQRVVREYVPGGSGEMLDALLLLHLFIPSPPTFQVLGQLTNAPSAPCAWTPPHATSLLVLLMEVSR